MIKYVKADYHSPDKSTLFDGEYTPHWERDLDSFPYYVRYFNEDKVEVDIEVYDTIEEADKNALNAVKRPNGNIYQARVYLQETNECLEIYERNETDKYVKSSAEMQDTVYVDGYRVNYLDDDKVFIDVGSRPYDLQEYYYAYTKDPDETIWGISRNVKHNKPNIRFIANPDMEYQDIIDRLKQLNHNLGFNVDKI